MPQATMDATPGRRNNGRRAEPGRSADPAAELETAPEPAPVPSDRVPQAPGGLLTTADLRWREECLRKVGHIPSGYTYLAQLMGHDMGSSVLIASVPHLREGAASPPAGSPDPSRRTDRYNLIENPLTLETIYGPGPTMLSHVYDPQTMLFRLSPRARQAFLYPAIPASGTSFGAPPVRALYDERNRDTLMLHELTVAWMQYHNLCVQRLLKTADRAPLQAYADARAHVVRVWHDILRNDLLSRFVHPAIADLGEGQLSSDWMLDETSLLAGLSRAFHALPLAAYRFSSSGPHNLDRLKKSGYQASPAEKAWRVGWDQFFGADGGGPLTGVSASVAGELRTGGRPIAALDIESARKRVSLRPGDARMASMIARLPGDWPQRISPDLLAHDFAAAHPGAPMQPTAQSLANGPLHQFLMVEAQCHGQKGGFGPLGSALLRATVEGTIRRVALPAPASDLDGFRAPTTMLELINLVRELNEWPLSTT